MRGRVAMGLCVAALCAPASASATVYTVNTTADHAVGPCDAADCTLREALTAAGAPDTVTLPAGTYNLNAQFGELDLTGAKLNGAGARSTIIDGGLATRVLATASAVTPVGTVNPSVSGVTIRRGKALGLSTTNIGGGILVGDGTLTLVNSQVLNSTAETNGGGIGLTSSERLTMIGSTVAGNASGGSGGGIYAANEGLVVAVNSTISGNTAADTDRGGGGVGGGSPFALVNVTVAGNSAPIGGGLAIDDVTLQNTIVAANGGTECANTGVVTSNNSLASDASCGLDGTGDLQSVNPSLGPLANNGGPTDTRAVAPPSLAVNHGGSGCQTTDQRGIVRPQLGVCDIGAFEYVAPRVTVVTTVVNDQGGTTQPADVPVHVRRAAVDVVGSPAPGTATGRSYTLSFPSGYAVAADAPRLYVVSYGGACSPSGAVAVGENQVRTCTVTLNDKAPLAKKQINALPKSGTVRIKLPGSDEFVELTEGDQIPPGTIVDVRKGRITLVAAGDSKADFYGGLFKLSQGKGAKPLTTLRLVERLTGCKAKGKAGTAARKKKKRRLWGDGKGRFRTKGKHSAATVWSAPSG